MQESVSLLWSVTRKFPSGMQEYKNLSWVRDADKEIHPRVTVWLHEAVSSDAKQSSRGTDSSIRNKQP